MFLHEKESRVGDDGGGEGVGLEQGNQRPCICTIKNCFSSVNCSSADEKINETHISLSVMKHTIFIIVESLQED
jgi:hypothetical protein